MSYKYTTFYYISKFKRNVNLLRVIKYNAQLNYNLSETADYHQQMFKGFDRIMLSLHNGEHHKVYSAVYSVQGSVECTIHSTQYSVQRTVYSVQCTVYSVECSVYILCCPVDHSGHLCPAPPRAAEEISWSREFVEGGPPARAPPQH